MIGIEFWILPEIFENDSFVPYYTFKKMKDTGCAVLVRIVFIICTIAYIGFLYLFPESYEGIGDVLLNSYDDVVVWGKDYIAFNFTKDISNKTLTYEKLLESEEDEIATPIG